MKRLLLIFLMAVAGLFADVSVSQAQTYLAPAGGITVKDLAVRTDGWVLVTFVEPISNLTVCGTWDAGAISYSSFMFLDMSTPTGKQVYASLLGASLTGHKLSGVGVSIATNNCYLLHVRISQ
jgi:hypothetical protein